MTASDFRSKSFWLETLPEKVRPEPGVTGTFFCDVVIIGGGYTGLSTAIHLRELSRKIRVHVLEKEICGYGASGRNGGFSMTLFGLAKSVTQMRFGREKARAAHRYMEEAVDYQRSFVKRHKISCDFEKSGYLLVATGEAQKERLEHDFEIAHQWGIEGVERWDSVRLAREFQTDRYLLGWYEKRCAILNPAKLARGMKKAALKAGAVVHENSPVVSAEQKSGRWIIKTPTGTLEAGQVVFATNAYTHLFPGLSSLETPAFTHIVLSEPLTSSQMKSIGWKNRAGVEDCLNLIHYYRLTKDNRILMGGHDVSVGFGRNMDLDHNEKTFRLLEEHVFEIFPQLRGLRFTHRWGGPVSVTLDMAPAIGYASRDKSALYSVGCVGHGVSSTLLNGLTLAELLLGRESTRTQTFFVGRRTIPWPPEPLRYALAQTVRGLLRAQDHLVFRKR